LTESIPKGWAVATLGDLVHLNPKNYLDDSLDAGFVPLSSLGTRFRQHHGVEVRPWKEIKKGYTHFSDGDVVLARITPSFENGKAGIIRDLPNKVGAGSTEYFVCRPLRGVLLPEYLLAFFKTSTFLNEGQQVMNGAVGQQRVPKHYLTSQRIHLPPYNEQKRITTKLNSLLARLDGCHERLVHVPSMLKRLRDSSLTAAMTGTLSEEWRRESPETLSWKKIRLQDVTEHLDYGSSAKSAQTGQVPVLRMGNIQEGKIDWSDLVYTSDVDEIGKYGLEDGDVLFNRTNSPELVGKTAVFKGLRKAIYAGYLIRIRCLPALDPDFLSICLNSPAGRDYCRRVKSDGVSQSNISATKLADFEFSMPAVAEQREIVSRYEAVLNHIEVLRTTQSRSLEWLHNLEQSILTAALGGKLVAQDQHDEPARQLLEQVESLKQQFEHATLLDQKRGRITTMKKFSKDTLKAAIQGMSMSSFTSDQLRASVATEYEHFKDVLFSLLDESQPIVTQTFDPISHSVMLTRVSK